MKRGKARLIVVRGKTKHHDHSQRTQLTIIGLWTPADRSSGRRISVPATPGKETEPGLVVYRFGADLFYVNDNRFTDEVRALVDRAPTPVRRFIVDAGALTDTDYSAAQSIPDLLDDLSSQRIGMVFARVSPYLRSDMDRHRITPALGEARNFTTLHKASLRCALARSRHMERDNQRIPPRWLGSAHRPSSNSTSQQHDSNPGNRY